jgi:thioredoxin 1
MSVIVKKFSATWCQPCKRLSPVFESAIKPKYPSGVIFEDIDVNEDSSDQVAEYGVRSVPTVIVEHNGVVVQRISGLNPVHVYTDVIDSLLN